MCVHLYLCLFVSFLYVSQLLLWRMRIQRVNFLNCVNLFMHELRLSGLPFLYFFVMQTRLKFSPKVLPKKAPKIIPKPEPQEENKVLTIDKKLITKLGSLQSTYGPGSGTKDEKQGTPVQVAFGQAYPSIPRTFPTPRSFSSGTSAIKLPKEHNEPWDYTCTDCPVTLPLKRPNSGDTEILDEAELGHSSSRAQDGELSAAEELCLTGKPVGLQDWT
ncbi:hypothetical protein PVAP13_1NG251400 [Panicum virgatum]|uniref:Uncharacterized protein n=2 Tax=Panicum virgatum TaxID=38727 RepID=A0A8T0WZZ1_PANVG|nr:hypothetical protein PVAP13_1NG251400 [Panicum virgatum]